MLTRVLSEARRPMAFLGQARRHSVDVETSPPGGKPRLSLSWMLILVARVPPGTLATRAPETPLTRSPWKSWWPGSRWRLPALSLLGTWDSVVPSFLPQTQSQRRQAGDRHAIGRAGHVVQAHAVAELDRTGLAAVFAADADFKIRTGLAAQLHAHLDKFSHALLIEHGERIVLEDFGVLVLFLELRVIVA